MQRRLGYVRRKFTTCKQPVSTGFLKGVGLSFYHQIDEIVSKYNVPSELIINMDQAPLPFFLAPKGDLTVPIRNCSDYRQLTGTFAISMTLIYQGKTDRCHPNFAFPEEFHLPTHQTIGLMKKNLKNS